MPRILPRNKEQKMFDALYYIIEHPCCHKTNVLSRCGLSNSTKLIWNLYNNGYITNYHVKSLRKNCNLIAITKKGINYVYSKKETLKPSYKL